MEELSRRKLITSASVGLAAAGALAVTRPLQGSSAAGAVDLPHIDSLAAPVIAQVEDLASGKVALHTGERTVTVIDHALAQDIARHVS
jgi:hypothetical protein